MQQEFYFDHKLPKLFVLDKLEQFSDIGEFLTHQDLSWPSLYKLFKKDIFKNITHLKAETTNTKVIKEVLAGNLFGLSALLTAQAASVKDCKVCPLRGKCTRDGARSLNRHIYEDYLKHARKQTKTPFYRISQRMRKLIEGLFGKAKEYMGLRIAKFRRLWNVEKQFLLIATAQNIKKMVKLLHRGNKEARKAIQGVQISLIMPSNGLGLLYLFQKHSCLPQAGLRIIFCSC